MEQEQNYAPVEPSRSYASANSGLDVKKLDYSRIIRAVLRHAWIIFLVAVALGSLMYFNSKQKAYVRFRTQTTLAFTIITYTQVVHNEGEADQYFTNVPSRNYYEKANLARLSQLLKGDRVVELLRDAILEKYHVEYTTGELRSAIEMAGTGDPAIFMLSVTKSGEEGRDFCNYALDRLIAIYPDYLKNFQTTLDIEVVRRPVAAQMVDNSDESRKSALMGLLIGGGLTAGLFVLLELSKHTIRSGQDIRNQTAERMLGMTPFQPQKRRMRRKDADRVPHICDKRTVSFDFIENVKAIRTKLENVAESWNAKVFAVTSTFEGEGKTTISINLACALAQMGKNVLLIDCDLRKPAVCKGIGVQDSDASGILPILNFKSTYEESVKYIKPLRIFILPTGGSTDHPPEKLSTEAMRGILQKAREEFDYVIIDTPPARVVSDCITMAPLVDGLIYAIRYDFARVNQINETLDEINSAGIRVVGSVLTMAAPENLVRRNGYSSAYHRPGKYYGGYGYGYGYSAESRYGHYGRYGYGYGQNTGARQRTERPPDDAQDV
ncbi:MAG: CpsD/CapB family tyrosine-protein kinase [Oscillospiraceae bacterium]|jgi:capsular exopolysaccharide synthesis family protein|nr:CpsD/CapB family tyrosine-protein kinase [Oscillospiraceae bacterium]